VLLTVPAREFPPSRPASAAWQRSRERAFLTGRFERRESKCLDREHVIPSVGAANGSSFSSWTLSDLAVFDRDGRSRCPTLPPPLAPVSSAIDAIDAAGVLDPLPALVAGGLIGASVCKRLSYR